MTIDGDIATPSTPLSKTERRTLVKNTPRESAIITRKIASHNAKSGLNPLVDAAAYLFSIIGKLKNLSSYRELNKLQKELIQEINHFQESAKNQGYSSEYILVSRYAICATMDDIIANTNWGGEGQWDNYNMLTVFNQENHQNDRFFVLLERIIKDPNQYIDVMELMYFCLSLGFKGSYRHAEFGNSQLEQITHALYKRIKNYRGDSSRILAPYPLKPRTPTPPSPKNNAYLIAGLTITIIMIIFVGFEYIIDTASTQSLQELNQIGSHLIEKQMH